MSRLGLGSALGHWLDDWGASAFPSRCFAEMCFVRAPRRVKTREKYLLERSGRGAAQGVQPALAKC